MKKILIIALVLLLVFILTMLTQIGGVAFLISLALYPHINKKVHQRFINVLSKVVCFVIIYSLATFLLVPLLAKPFGRVPLPVNNIYLQPATMLTIILNRHYVNPELSEMMLRVSKKMNKRFSGTTTNYLDANFPFIHNFPLFPHLSHDDGEKLDLSFFYINKETGNQTSKLPSAIGYGVNEEPKPNEVNTARQCAEKGFWQYGLLTKLVPQGDKHKILFDERRTKALLKLLINEDKIGKIFIEPHLKNRMKLRSDKIRFQGCQSVRHDDHIHLQLR